MRAMEKLESGARKLGLRLNQRQLEQFYIYYRELVDWNKRLNLTSITRYEDVQIKHFLDSLTVILGWPQTKTGADLRTIDVGTGAGVPGIPLKIMLPDVRLVLLDSTAKKITFLSHLTNRLELDNVEIMVSRAEDVAHQAQYREKFDVVLSRGVAPLVTLVELTLPFGAVGGSLIAQKKGDVAQEIDQARPAINLLGGKLRGVKRVDLEGFTDERQLVIVDKVSPTPELYPRRPGVPAKRPLHGSFKLTHYQT
jgi:16S rRNA (guanine527-N7)-methyltransferase